MTYEDHLRKVSEGTARVVAQVFAAWQDGRIDQEAFLDLVRTIVATGNAQARALALVALRGYVEAATGTPQAVAVPARPDDAERLTKALQTILEAELDTGMQLHRLASNEPLDAATRAFNDGMAAHPQVEGWVRGLEADACELCRWWWREGRVWRPDHPMPRHTGCLCTPVPTITATDNYQTEKQHQGAMETRAQRSRRTA